VQKQLLQHCQCCFRRFQNRAEWKLVPPPKGGMGTTQFPHIGSGSRNQSGTTWEPVTTWSQVVSGTSWEPLGNQLLPCRGRRHCTGRVPDPPSTGSRLRPCPHRSRRPRNHDGHVDHVLERDRSAVATYSPSATIPDRLDGRFSRSDGRAFDISCAKIHVVVMAAADLFFASF